MMIIETIIMILAVISVLLCIILEVGKDRYDNGLSKYSPHHPSNKSSKNL